jgi:hypothetical protein
MLDVNQLFKVPRVVESTGPDGSLRNEKSVENMMSQKDSMNIRIACGSMKMPALQVQSETLVTLAHSSHFTHSLVL